MVLVPSLDRACPPPEVRCGRPVLPMRRVLRSCGTVLQGRPAQALRERADEAVRERPDSGMRPSTKPLSFCRVGKYLTRILNRSEIAESGICSR